MRRMVRRDVEEGLIPEGGGPTATSCATPTGESPAPAGAGEPGIRAQVVEGDLRARAGRQEPVRRRNPRSGKQARGPQHEVKPAAPTDPQPAGRAAHVTAKATPLAQEPKRAGVCGGVRAAARVQGVERNTRDPSARPLRWDRAYFESLGLPRLRGSIRYPGKDPGNRSLRHAASRRPLASRVREIRTHGLKGGVGSEPALRAD
jgi:hypothetical protein